MRYQGPSIKTLRSTLKLSAADAGVIKSLMNGEEKGLGRLADQLGIKGYTTEFNVILLIANKILNGFGVEYLPSSDDTYRGAYGIEYVNMGDAYDPTLMFDLEKGKFIAGDWGSQVETQPRRFGR